MERYHVSIATVYVEVSWWINFFAFHEIVCIHENKNHEIYQYLV